MRFPGPEAVRLRPAGVDDRAVLERWDTYEHVIAASGDDDAFDWAAELPRDVPWRELLIAEEAGRPVGVIQVIDPREEETRYWGEVDPDLRAIDIWIGEPTDLGRGIGTAMMRLVLDRCFADPVVQAVLIDPLASNVAAQRFYRRLGFVDVGPRVFGSDRCLVMRLARDDWEHRRGAVRAGR